MLENHSFRASFGEDGHLSDLFIINDAHKMNWVITNDYLEKLGYAGEDKLFGNFDLRMGQEELASSQIQPKIVEEKSAITVTYDFEKVSVRLCYDFTEENQLDWSIDLFNQTDQDLVVDDFGVWISLKTFHHPLMACFFIS